MRHAVVLLCVVHSEYGSLNIAMPCYLKGEALQVFMVIPLGAVVLPFTAAVCWQLLRYCLQRHKQQTMARRQARLSRMAQARTAAAGKCKGVIDWTSELLILVMMRPWVLCVNAL